MTIEFSINKIEKKDLQQIENIGKECLPIFYCSSDLFFLLMDSNYILYKAHNKDNIFGFIIAEIKDNKERIHIKTIAISKKYRRNGIGKDLINKLKNKNIPEISLYVLENNTDAIKFYYKQDFIFIKKIVEYYKF